MGSSFAFLAYVFAIACLFFLDRDSSSRTSKALWLPVVWLWINGSRPLSAWLGMGLPSDAPGQLPASSLLDQLVAGLLMVFGFNVIFRRRKDVIPLLKASWPIALYFGFCLVSVLWSDFPGWAFKRWVRALGDLVMVMIIITDPRPTYALRRFFSRVGFMLLPFSLLLIKYFPNLGRAYDVWGLQMIVGVTTNKNMLGVMTLVVTLGTLWQLLSFLRDRKQPNRQRHLLAQGALLGCGITLLFSAHSATSGACFALGAGLMTIFTLPFVRTRPAVVHALVLAILLGGATTVLFAGRGEVAHALGRNADLTGRTEVWEVLIPMVPNPVVGAGFETFWLGPRIENLWHVWYGVNEAHNGFLEVYLNLGWFGVGLIALVLFHGYRKAVAACRHNSTVAGLLITCIITTAIYSATEAGFRMLDPTWVVLLLSVIAASRIALVGTYDPVPRVGEVRNTIVATRLSGLSPEPARLQR